MLKKKRQFIYQNHRRCKVSQDRNPNNARVSTIKSQLDVMETPQAIAIVTHEVIEQQQAQQLSDVVKCKRCLYYVCERCFKTVLEREVTLLAMKIFTKTGSRVNSGIFPEVSGLERVEVLKGSAAIFMET